MLISIKQNSILAFNHYVHIHIISKSVFQMGAEVFSLTSTSETAADLAARCGGKPELVQLLRAAEGTIYQYLWWFGVFPHVV